MADAITWKWLGATQLQELALCRSADDCKRELAHAFKIDFDSKKQRLLADFFFFQYSTFAREQHLRDDQISVILGILKHLIDRDFDHDSSTTLESSFAAFKSLLLAHSVERSPKSVQLFTPTEFSAIVDSFVHSYYRQFQLYKRIFTPFHRIHLTQRSSECVQQPLRPRPLEGAFLHLQHEPQQAQDPPTSAV